MTTLPASCTALAISSGVESPFLGFLALMGKRIILDLYSFSLWAFSCRDSTLLFLHRMLVNKLDEGKFRAEGQN